LSCYKSRDAHQHRLVVTDNQPVNFCLRDIDLPSENDLFGLAHYRESTVAGQLFITVAIFLLMCDFDL